MKTRATKAAINWLFNHPASHRRPGSGHMHSLHTLHTIDNKLAAAKEPLTRRRYINHVL
jgi:hypothetical protein